MRRLQLFFLLLLAPWVASFVPISNSIQIYRRTLLAAYHVQIEYSLDWQIRSFWLAQELLTTFAKEEALEAVSLIPYEQTNQSDNCLRVQVLCNATDAQILWEDEEFLEPKQLKQLVRDCINPQLDLGHSDRNTQPSKLLYLKSKVDEQKTSRPTSSLNYTTPHHLFISYCTGCQWLSRANFLALQVVNPDMSVTLAPCRKGGTFVVLWNDDEVLWDRKEMGGFPSTDKIVNRINQAESLSSSIEDEDMDDDDAFQQRAYFGVL